MSHSSGIPVGTKLRDAFGRGLSGELRLIKVQIENEELVPVTTKPKSGDFDSDLSSIGPLLDAGDPSYFLMRTDSDQSQFVLFCYVPSKSKVKDKMLYASTRSNLKQQLGANYFIDEVFGDIPSDFTAEGYKKHVEGKKVEAPLTEQEQIKSSLLEQGEIYTGGASTYVHGVAFPIDAAAANAVKKLVGGQLNYVQIAIDCDNEKIVLQKSESGISIDKVKTMVPTDEPRFHVFVWNHDNEGSRVDSTIFVFSCPDGSKGTKSAPVRMRMLYSSSKANVAEIVKQAGGNIDAKIEINVGDEISEEDLLNILHPKKAEAKQNFSKPSRPGKGGARLIKKT